MPSPVQMSAFVEGSNTRPSPPVARMVAFARIAWTSPVRISIATTPPQRPWSVMSVVAYHSS